ncbi:ABC-type xylose transport system, permease component [Sphaerochaeta pleomorpha str. Grapes]|uniref:Xylose transport system permease protein XylH n=1 Tax=Sphaerochaeta pleomorpha (strain ATCC BAA-1885 / DSM 22778 / Grapes) TaxID=158190 RepID=G8QXU0_SPHPG|nr:multiple monosaccharide ABC transporter permease [Sphaerochaeta pleomorpha]AEV30734.1 ABC-type xylose transport system, permease component [Sphaerochaeta pleomorpha str. Grapes]
MINTSVIKNTMKKNSMLIALIATMILFQLLIVSQDRGSLFAPANISNIISQNSYVVILASGMLLCILTGGNIDLSVGSIVALVGAVAGTLVVNMHLNIFLSIIICLIVGTLIGAWQGFWIAFVRIPPFIVTLAGMLLWRGVALLILNGLTISPFPESYQKYFTTYLPGTSNAETIFTVTLLVGIIICLVYIAFAVFDRFNKKRKGYQTEHPAMTITRTVLISFAVLLVFSLLGRHKGIPVVLIQLAVIVLAYSYYTSSTVPGRHLYAIGGNEKAAKLSGINTDKVLFSAYTNMGFLSAVAALVCVARFNSAAPTAGTNYELDAIGACFIGGASAYGGTGTVGGAVIGAIFMGVLNNGMSILGVDSNWQKAVKGIVVLGAVVFDVLSKKRVKSN